MLPRFSNLTDFFSKSLNKINFKDLQYCIRSPEFVIINTLPASDQDCLIQNTLPCEREEKTINDLLNQYDLTAKKFVIYGKNASDDSAEKKYRQLVNLGFAHVYLYPGGIFEWMLLQDIYGKEDFPTTKNVLDILRFSGAPSFYR
jgi:hypothetical protein